MFFTRPFHLYSYRTVAMLKPYRISLLGLAWVTYMAFTILGYPLFGVSVMLPSILLCGFPTWLYNYKIGLLTSLLSQPYNVLMMMYNLDSLAGWRPALEIGGFLAQIITVGSMALLTANHKKISDLNYKLEERIRERIDELNELTEFLTRQDWIEKNRLADRLYTDAASQLSTLMMECKTLSDQFIATNHPQAQAASTLTQLAQTNIELIKNIAQDLSSENLEKLGLEQAVRNMAAYFQEAALTTFSIVINPLHHELPKASETILYRIIHETVTNALRHGRASHIEIELHVTNNGFTLTVINNGSPIPPAISEGTGLHLIRQRATEINAAVCYRRMPDGRTHFECISNSKSTG